jgi:hypothetical protein
VRTTTPVRPPFSDTQAQEQWGRHQEGTGEMGRLQRCPFCRRRF